MALFTIFPGKCRSLFQFRPAAASFLHDLRRKKVLVICRSGNRSSQATKLLRNNGFTNVYNVLGGMNHWPGPVEK
ncbi:rhodanese-like domain-containing protein [Thermosinus carboxydivorans]|nr:rhodanese-like domain-containing protein [Thermosinus carboxydivorans]